MSPGYDYLFFAPPPQNFGQPTTRNLRPRSRFINDMGLPRLARKWTEALQRFVSETSNEKSDWLFLSSNAGRALASGEQRTFEPEFWKQNFQIKTIDTCRYVSFAPPLNINIVATPRRAE